MIRAKGRQEGVGGGSKGVGVRNKGWEGEMREGGEEQGQDSVETGETTGVNQHT